MLHTCRSNSRLPAQLRITSAPGAASAKRLPDCACLTLVIERLLPPTKLIELSKRGPTEPVQYVVDVLHRNHMIVNLLNE